MSILWLLQNEYFDKKAEGNNVGLFGKLYTSLSALQLRQKSVLNYQLVQMQIWLTLSLHFKRQEEKQNKL